MRYLYDPYSSSPSPALLPGPRLLSLRIPRWGRGNFPQPVRGRALAPVPFQAEPRVCFRSSRRRTQPRKSHLPVTVRFPAPGTHPGEGEPCAGRRSVPLRTSRGRKGQEEGSHRSEGRTPPRSPRFAGRSLTRGAVGCRPPPRPQPPPPPRCRAG